MGLPFSDIDDAVLETQEHFIKKGSFLDMQTDLTDHVAVREMWKGRKKKFAGGRDWRFEVQMDHNHSAKTHTPAFSLAEQAGAISVIWEPNITVVSDEDCDRMLSPDKSSGAGKRAAAIEWLQGVWGIGVGGKEPGQVIREAQAAGHSRRTLYRAAEEIGVVMGAELWQLPTCHVSSPYTSELPAQPKGDVVSDAVPDANRHIGCAGSSDS